MNLRKSQIFLSEDLFQRIENIVLSLEPFLKQKQKLSDSYSRNSNERNEIIMENEKSLANYAIMMNELKRDIMQEDQLS